jgi:hypothetical protein
LAIDLSRRILAHAKQKNWSDVQQLDAERMTLLEEIFSGQRADANNKEAAARLQELIDLNNEAMEICTEAKQGVLTEGRKIRQGKEAVAAYMERQADKE